MENSYERTALDSLKANDPLLAALDSDIARHKNYIDEIRRTNYAKDEFESRMTESKNQVLDAHFFRVMEASEKITTEISRIEKDYRASQEKNPSMTLARQAATRAEISALADEDLKSEINGIRQAQAAGDREKLTALDPYRLDLILGEYRARGFQDFKIASGLLKSVSYRDPWKNGEKAAGLLAEAERLQGHNLGTFYGGGKNYHKIERLL